jgi:hypothetical protein
MEADDLALTQPAGHGDVDDLQSQRLSSAGHVVEAGLSLLLIAGRAQTMDLYPASETDSICSGVI